MGFFTPVRTLPRDRRPPSKRTFKILFESMLLSQDGQPVRKLFTGEEYQYLREFKTVFERFYGMANKGKDEVF
jgi:hypothetical protein